jgi:hypothetical protein
MSVIEAATAGFKDMADGTVRFFFDVEPRHAGAALELFRARGTPAALAALQVGYAAADWATNKESLTVEKPKGGPLSQLAGRWCNDPEFWFWLETNPDNACHSALGAVACLYDICEIESRAELDHDPIAAEKFNKRIRGPYSEHLIARRIVA